MARPVGTGGGTDRPSGQDGRSVRGKSARVLRPTPLKNRSSSTDTGTVSSPTDSVPPPGTQWASEGTLGSKTRPLDAAARSRRRVTFLRPLVLVAAVLLLAAAALIFVSSGGGSAQRSLKGASFSTHYPSAWTLTTTHPYPGITSYALGSTSEPVNQLGIPPHGAIGITVEEYRASVIPSSIDPDATTQSPGALLQHVIGTPRAAMNSVVLTPLHATGLDGTAAAAMVYSYTYGNIPNVQSDVVSRHGATIVTIEMDTAPSLTSTGNSAMAKLIADWRWR